MHRLSPRQRAIAEGRKTYFTGEPCSNGHIAERNVASCICVQCNRYHQQESRRRANLNSIKAQCGFIDITVQCDSEVAGLVRQFAEAVSAYRYDSLRTKDLELIATILNGLDSKNAELVRKFVETLGDCLNDPRRQSDLDLISAVLKSLDDEHKQKYPR